jgi:hypothetical protein
MLRLVTYHFEDHPELGPVVSFLRSGVGYLDRGNDLEELAEIYREHRDVIAHDPKHYRASDEADARDRRRSPSTARSGSPGTTTTATGRPCRENSGPRSRTPTPTCAAWGSFSAATNPSSPGSSPPSARAAPPPQRRVTRSRSTR